MFEVNLSPIAFSVGNFHVSFYFIVYFIGFVFSFLYFLIFIRRKQIKLEERQLYDLAVLSVLGFVLGARLFYTLFWAPGSLAGNFWHFFVFSGGGFSFHGGFFGALLFAGVYSYFNGINLLK